MHSLPPYSPSAPAVLLSAQRADPWVMRHQGQYFFTASVPEYDRVVLRKASSLKGLTEAAEHVIWKHPDSGPMGGYIWAPELHWFDGSWHLYFAAGDEDDPFRIRMYVMSNPQQDPLSPAWGTPQRIWTHEDTFSLDATTFEHQGKRYMCWAQADLGVDTSLFIAEMSSPSTLAGPPSRIAIPHMKWETATLKVNEGPAALVRHNRVFLTFSANATDATYCVGMLMADSGADLLDPTAWTKLESPVLESSAEEAEYGPGHNAFTVDESGRDVIVYHARPFRDFEGHPLYEPNRHAYFRPFEWDGEDLPVFRSHTLLST